MGNPLFDNLAGSPGSSLDLDLDSEENEFPTSSTAHVDDSEVLSYYDECDMLRVRPDRPKSPASVFDFPSIGWSSVSGLDSNQITALEAIATKGVKWKHTSKEKASIFTLHYGGSVESDGNCLYSSFQHILQLEEPRAVRKIAVNRFLNDYDSGLLDKQTVDRVIKNMYAPDLSSGWGIHIVQEIKLVAKKLDREEIENSINDLVNCGMTRESAAESVLNEKCTLVNDGYSWARYMAVSGSPSDEDYLVSLQYIEDGLLTVDENPSMTLAAFGDDIAIESIATEFCSEIFVVQSHGSDAMMASDSPLFFLPHSPRGGFTSINHPMFLFMKGTGWCGAGADHYDPIIAKVENEKSFDKVAIEL